MPLEGGRDASRQMMSRYAEHPEQGAHKWEVPAEADMTMTVAAQPNSSGRAHSGSAANSSANSHSARAKGPSTHTQNDAQPSMHTNPQHNTKVDVQGDARTEQRDADGTRSIRTAQRRSANAQAQHDAAVQSEGEWRRVVEEYLPEVLAPHPNSPAHHAGKMKRPERMHSSPDAIEVEPGSANADDTNSMRTGQHYSANAHSESDSARAERHADVQYRHEGIKYAPEPWTPPMKCPKRPIEDANPPHRCG
ncbi:hypothetical protein BU15DRAFT_62789 [Melanogaster broomeanus]|nr:hypothetical protein BU15DRAFT_62789 [Melanogaster broomeanus]